MDLSKGHIKALQEGDLSSPKGIEACINASEALSQCMNVALKPGTPLTRHHPLCENSTFRCARAVLVMLIVWFSGHDKLMAVKQQQHLFSDLRDTFARRLTNHLNNVFVHQVTLLHTSQVKNTHILHCWQCVSLLRSFRLPFLFLWVFFLPLSVCDWFFLLCSCLATSRFSLYHFTSLCFLFLCQFNHFSHFKMTIPQFYRSSCLSLPVSTPTPASCLTRPL